MWMSIQKKMIPNPKSARQELWKDLKASKKTIFEPQNWLTSTMPWKTLFNEEAAQYGFTQFYAETLKEINFFFQEMNSLI